jgi:hypothetical protein
MEPMGIERHRWEKPRGRMSGSERVKITEDVRKFAADQQISEQEALQVGLEQKAKEFKETGDRGKVSNFIA